jgi:hypothetical protein
MVKVVLEQSRRLGRLWTNRQMERGSGNVARKKVDKK